MSEKLEFLVAAELGSLGRPHATSEDNICQSLRQAGFGSQALDLHLPLASELADFIAEDGTPAGRKFSFQLHEDFDDRRLRHLDYAVLGRRRKNSVEM